MMDKRYPVVVYTHCCVCGLPW